MNEMMRYECEVDIAVCKVTKTYILGFDFEIVDGRVDVQKTFYKSGYASFYHWFDAGWFWDICPESISKMLDKEMLEAWNCTHALKVERVS